MRIDKYLWCIRLFKTRSLATEACKTKKVLLKEETVKPAKEISVGDLIEVRRQGIWMAYRVEALPKSRLGAKLVPDYVSDVTPEEELQKLENIKNSRVHGRDKGLGRPTKKERRDLDEFIN